MGKILNMQPSLLHVPTVKDVVYTPPILASAIVSHFRPSGRALDPCAGDGVFFDNLVDCDRHWCEIERGRDFFLCDDHYDWIIGNPPYSCLIAWIRHSFTLAENVCYLMPLHRVFASDKFLLDIEEYGGIKEIMCVGTGADWGFPFGHALGAVHYQKGWMGDTGRSRLRFQE